MYLRAGLDDLVAEDVWVGGILLVVTPLGPAVVDQLPVVLVLLGVQDKIAAKGRGRCVCVVGVGG